MSFASERRTKNLPSAGHNLQNLPPVSDACVPESSKTDQFTALPLLLVYPWDRRYAEGVASCVFRAWLAQLACVRNRRALIIRSPMRQMSKDQTKSWFPLVPVPGRFPAPEVMSMTRRVELVPVGVVPSISNVAVPGSTPAGTARVTENVPSAAVRITPSRVPASPSEMTTLVPGR